MSQRLYWVDLCRTIAILGVIIIHVCAIYINDISYFSYKGIYLNLLDSFSRVSVPLFFMLSGALILSNRQDKFKNIKRIKKVLIPLIFWSLFYIGYLNYYGVTMSYFQFFKQPVMYHLWFAYSIIGVYILSPIIELMFLSILKERKIIYYTFGVWFLICLLVKYENDTILNLFGIGNGNLVGYLGYFLSGGIIYYFRDKLYFNKAFYLITYVLSSLMTAILTIILSNKNGSWDFTAYSYLSPNVIISSFSMFIFFIKQNRDNTLAISNFLRLASENTFFIYFIHIIFISKLQPCFDGYSIYFSVFFITVITFFVSFLFGLLFRKPSLMKHLLG